MPELRFKEREHRRVERVVMTLTAVPLILSLTRILSLADNQKHRQGQEVPSLQGRFLCPTCDLN